MSNTRPTEECTNNYKTEQNLETPGKNKITKNLNEPKKSCATDNIKTSEDQEKITKYFKTKKKEIREQNNENNKQATKNTKNNRTYKTYASQKTKFPRAIIQISKPYNLDTMFHEELSDRDNCTISVDDPNNPKKRLFISSNYLPEAEDINNSLFNMTNEKQDKNKNGLISCT